MRFERLGPTAPDWLAQTRHRYGEKAVQLAQKSRRAELFFVKKLPISEDAATLPRARVPANANDAREAFRAAHRAHMTALQELAESEPYV